MFLSPLPLSKRGKRSVERIEVRRCDKKRFMSLTDTSMAAADSLRVRITADKAARTLTIEDSGIGMNREELVNNLGRIAMSGTKKFAEAPRAARFLREWSERRFSDL